MVGSTPSAYIRSSNNFIHKSVISLLTSQLSGYSTMAANSNVQYEAGVFNNDAAGFITAFSSQIKALVEAAVSRAVTYDVGD
jgi:hypothetical protein